LGVNLLGCLVIGFLMGVAENKGVFSPAFRLFIFIGFLGSFTTFSTFSYETYVLLKHYHLLYSALNVTLHLVGGFLGVWIGFILANMIS